MPEHDRGAPAARPASHGSAPAARSTGQGASGRLRAPGLAALFLLGACGGAPQPVASPELVPGPSPFEYPLSLWDSDVDGTTELMVHVSVAGSVDSVYVERGSGYPAFDSAAVAGARTLRFSPGRRGDEAVPAWTRVPVRFSHDSATVNLIPRARQEEP